MTDQIVRSAVANFAGGRFKRIAGTDVAANTEFSETVPAGKAWGLLAVHVVLVQGATQTPQPILVLDDGTTDFFRGFGSSAAQAASTTCAYTWAPDLALTGQVGSGANVHSHAGLPSGLVLPAGFRVRSSTLGIGANSNYDAPSIYVVEYVTS